MISLMVINEAFQFWYFIDFLLSLCTRCILFVRCALKPRHYFYEIHRSPEFKSRLKAIPPLRSIAPLEISYIGQLNYFENLSLNGMNRL